MQRSDAKRRPLAPAVQFDDLRPGDILFFRPSVEICDVQYLIMFMQSFCLRQSEHGGHFDTTHVAICIGHDENNKPVIAHIAPNGYTRETIENYDGIARAFIVFRHRDPRRNAEVYREATSDENNGLLWDFWAALRVMFTFPRLDPDRHKPKADQPPKPQPIKRKPRTRRTFCSKFAAECIKQAARNLGEEESFRTYISPKSMEACLTQHPDYEKMVYLGPQPYALLKARIAERLSGCKNQYAIDTFNRTRAELESDPNYTEQCRVNQLMRVMNPVLNSLLWKNDIAWLARKIGIFSHDFSCDETNSIPELQFASAKPG